MSRKYTIPMDSYGAGNGGYFIPHTPDITPLPIEIYTTKELCDEIIRRVQREGVQITGDLIDWLECKRNIDLLSKREDGE